MKLKNAKFYKALCYEIKLLGEKLPDGEQDLDFVDEKNYGNKCIGSFFPWRETREGADYWCRIDGKLHEKYVFIGCRTYVGKMMENYNKIKNPQIELDF